LSAHHGVPVEQILCGAGSLDVIAALARCYAGPGRSVLAPAHAYPFFRTAAQMADARFDTAPEDDCTASVDALLSAVRPDTSVVCLANPGNPTGTRLPLSEIIRLRVGLRGNILLIVDEAYGEFADYLGERAFDLSDVGNTVVLRTFSKAYGLAGARVGWGVFPPDVAAEVRKMLNPNGVSGAAQAAALAALCDQPYMRETVRLTSTARDTAIARLNAAGFRVLTSFTNFLLIDFGTAEAAQAADAALRGEGIFLRPQGGAGLPHTLRLTIGPEEAMAAVLTALETWKGAST
jgi:histidinol-phosphate aminotransferase